MLALNVTITGDKVIIDGLNQLAAELPHVVQRGLKTVARGVHRGAMDWLNGAGGNNSKTRIGKRQIKKEGLRSGFNKKSGERIDFKLWNNSGGYPVPVRTGNLKRLLDFVDPGQSKGSFAAGPLEVIVYDSAEYASTIHEGTGSSAKFGRRPYLEDALKSFNADDGIANAIENELNIEIKKRGLA